MSKITYSEKPDGKIGVYIGLRRIGTIRQLAGAHVPHLVTGGWCYYPTGDRLGGEVFVSLAACKHSLED